MCLVRADPTAVANMLMQRNIEASDGAFFRLGYRKEAMLVDVP